MMVILNRLLSASHLCLCIAQVAHVMMGKVYIPTKVFRRYLSNCFSSFNIGPTKKAAEAEVLHKPRNLASVVPAASEIVKRIGAVHFQGVNFLLQGLLHASTSQRRINAPQRVIATKELRLVNQSTNSSTFQQQKTKQTIARKMLPESM